MTKKLDQIDQLDLTNCDREPIHIPGGIQPIGFLLALSADWLVIRAANTADYLGKTAEELLGRRLGDVISAEAFSAIRARIAMLRGKDSMERILALSLTDTDQNFDVAVHFSDNFVVLECEPASEDQMEVSSITRGALSRLSGCRTVEALLNEGARQFRSLLEYDRVMVYRFTEDGSGEVVAQSKAKDQDNFLGLSFPATDIPVQARKLYIRNTFRIIADSEMEAVPISPTDEGTPLDLSMALYRAVSPIHLEYLRNMGVRASLSVSIIVDGKLWGLIACHHASPKTPTFAERSAAELFGQIFSLQLESHLRAELSDYESQARHVSSRLMTAAAQDASKLIDAEWLLDLMPRAIACQGIGVHMEGVVALAGLTPNEKDFMALVGTLNRAEAQTIHHSEELSAYVSAIDRDASAAAGFLAIPISRRPRDYMILFREEILKSVRWAGEPAKAVVAGKYGDRLAPRESFAEWRELVRGKAEPFKDNEVRVASALRTTLLEVVLHLTDSAAEEQRRSGEQQKLLIAELNHRVRNILALIRALMAQTKREGGQLSDVIDTLESRVKALANAHDLLTADNWGPTPFRTLISTELQAYLDREQSRIRLDGPDAAILPEAIPILALVVHEMATNAAKYGALSDSGSVQIEWKRRSNGDLFFDWKERGGPVVKEPSRRGFGTTVINSSIPHELGGEASIAYKTSGVEGEFLIPARFVKYGREIELDKTRAADAGMDGTLVLDDKKILLVEDSMIIALDAEDKIRELGAMDVILAATNEAAMRAIETENISAAMLDFNLGSETSLPTAQALTDKNVPFFFASGYGNDDAIPAEFASLPLVVKPYTGEQIERALKAALGN